jgi:hypothetical protein
MIEIAKWLNKICGKKPKKYVLQGFKNHGKFICDTFKNKKDTRDSFLQKLREVLEPYFEKIEIRS